MFEKVKRTRTVKIYKCVYWIQLSGLYTDNHPLFLS